MAEREGGPKEQKKALGWIESLASVFFGKPLATSDERAERVGEA